MVKKVRHFRRKITARISNRIAHGMAHHNPSVTVPAGAEAEVPPRRAVAASVEALVLPAEVAGIISPSF